MSNYTISYEVNDKKLSDMIALDKQAYFYNDVGNFNLCKEWLKVNNELYTMLLCEDEVVGYINFMPLKKESYELYKQGKLKDYQITADDILPYENGKRYWMLIVSVVMGEKFKKSNLTLKLFKGFKNKLAELKSRNITFEKVLCECVSDEGLQNAIKLGLKPVNDSHFTEIYEGEINIV